MRLRLTLKGCDGAPGSRGRKVLVRADVARPACCRGDTCTARARSRLGCWVRSTGLSKPCAAHPMTQRSTSNPGTPNPAQHRHSNGRKSAQRSGVNPGSGAVLVTGASRAARASRVTLPSSTLFAHCPSPAPPLRLSRVLLPTAYRERERKCGETVETAAPSRCRGTATAAWHAGNVQPISRSLALSLSRRSLALVRSLAHSPEARSRPRVLGPFTACPVRRAQARPA